MNHSALHRLRLVPMLPSATSPQSSPLLAFGMADVSLEPEATAPAGAATPPAPVLARTLTNIKSQLHETFPFLLSLPFAGGRFFTLVFAFYLPKRRSPSYAQLRTEPTRSPGGT